MTMQSPVRMHYVCARHLESLKAEPHTTTPDGKPLRKLDPNEKKCCFCNRWAVERVKTDAYAKCPAGHIAPERLEALARAAYDESLDDAIEEALEEQEGAIKL